MLRACINRGEFCKALSTSSEVKWGSGAEKKKHSFERGVWQNTKYIEKKRKKEKKTAQNKKPCGVLIRRRETKGEKGRTRTEQEEMRERESSRKWEGKINKELLV